MSNDSLKILAATPPKQFIANLRDFTARIVELEHQLGLPAGAKIFNAHRAHQRIAELESQLAAKNALAVAPVAPVAPAATPAPAAKLTATEICRLAAAKNPVAAEIASLTAALPEASGTTRKMLETKIATLSKLK